MELEDSSDDPRPRLDAKIVLVGDGGVGKTSLIMRFTQNLFQEVSVYINKLVYSYSFFNKIFSRFNSNT